MSRNRLLDGQIAREIMGFEEVKVGPDADGLYEGAVLTPGGVSLKEMGAADILPSRGPVDIHFFVPFYSRNWGEAIQVACRVGLEMPVCRLTTPQALAEACLRAWRGRQGV